MSAFDQGRYQVRFDWGAAGARRIFHGAHAVVVCDELDGHGTRSAEALAAAVVEATATRVGGGAPAVLLATEGSATDASLRILRLQNDLGDRAIVAVVGAGSIDDDGFRTPVEDHLAAGAVVDALAALGLDSSSPEAAAACAAFTGLRRATSHLLTASVSATRPARGAGPQDARAQRAAHPAVCRVLRKFSAPE